MDESLLDLVTRTVNASSSLEKAVFYSLFAFSLLSWSLIFWKLFALYELRRNTRAFLGLFDNANTLGEILTASSAVGPSPAAAVFRAALHTLEQRPVATAPSTDPRLIAVKPQANQEELFLLSMRHTAQAQFQRLQWGLGFLASVGSTAPFIGLFGTVWGIMATFRDLGDAKSASLAVVAPSISSALIATAAGLAVAIPAVMAYNALLAQFDTQQDNCDSFIERLAAIVRGSGLLRAPGVTPAVIAQQAVPHA